MARPGTPTLDQLRVFLAIAESGSFSLAARRLGRSVSVTSYAIGNLEEELRIKLFERGSARQTQLTEAGRLLLDDVRKISESVDRLRGKVSRLHQGVEPEVRVAFDVMLSDDLVSDAVRRLHERYPLVALHARVEALGASTQLVLDRMVGIAITGAAKPDASGLKRLGLGSVQMVPVAAPGHALTQSQPAPQAKDHMQLVLTDRYGPGTGTDTFVNNSANTWRVADMTLKHKLLLDGMGWGYMPRARIRAHLAAGRLVQLVVPDAAEYDYSLYAIHRTDSPPGPATSYLLSQFASLSDA
jgi:DNA-binding transcriptional LysR family regulator